MPQNKGGIMVILSSPSGAGKTTLVKLLSEKNNFLFLPLILQGNPEQMRLTVKIIFLLVIKNLKD